MFGSAFGDWCISKFKIDPTCLPKSSRGCFSRPIWLPSRHRVLQSVRDKMNTTTHICVKLV